VSNASGKETYFPIGLIVLALILCAIPAFLPNRYYFDIAVKVIINAIVCLGLNLLIGYAGQISLGHAAFFAMGGYASALLVEKAGLPGIVAIAVGSIIVGGIAYAVARPILRLKGHFLAMATLGFGIIVFIIVNREIWLSGGPDGKPVPRFVLFNFPVSKIEYWYWISAAALLGSVWVASNIIHSPFGRALRALHSSEKAAAALAVDVSAIKVNVFVISAVFAAFAGSLFAFAEQFMTPGEAGFIRSIELVTMVVLGGMASIFGSILGATTLTLLGQALANFSEYKHIVLGSILILIMVFMPRGLAPALKQLLMRFRHK
jgi:branched-chain amino acid transport system permease protein